MKLKFKKMGKLDFLWPPGGNPAAVNRGAEM